MPDVKKLITGFLILAAGASSSAWILSTIGSSNQAGATSTAVVATSSPSLNNNAFVDNSQSQDLDDTGISPTSTYVDDPSNITDNLTDAFVDSMVAANPDGIQPTNSGAQEVMMPATSAITEELQDEPGVTNMASPNWDTEVDAAQNTIDVVPDSTSSIFIYLTAFNSLNATQLVESGLLATAENDVNADTADTSILPSANTAIVGMLTSAETFPTPSSFVKFQKSFLKLLVYEKNISVLLENNANDPVKSALALQDEQANYNDALQDFTNQSQVFNGFVSSNTQNGNSGFLGLIQNVLSIKTADAQAVVGVPTIDLTTKAAIAAASAAQNSNGWAVYFEKLAEDIALQVAKNVLVAQIQQHVLTWIQGSGAPRFIQQWGTTLVNAAQTSALSALNSNFACINTNGVFPQIQITLNAFYQSGNNVCASQFASQLSSTNLTQFWNKFSSGGFVTFGQTLLPTNNYYGGLFFTAQAAGAAAQTAQTAAQSKAIAGQGFTGSQTCNDGSNPNGQSYACFDNTTGVEYYPNPNGTCDPGETKQLAPNNGLCANGSEPGVTMPSIVTGQQLSSAVDSGPKLATAANSVAGIINALASSLITSIASEITSVATTQINGALTSQPSSGSDGGLLSINPASLAAGGSAANPLQCANSPTAITLDPTSGQATVQLYAVGGANDANGNPPTYTWVANGAMSASAATTDQTTPFTVTYNTPGTYFAIMTASTDNTTSSCEVDVSAGTAPAATITPPDTSTDTTSTPSSTDQ